jgi:ribose transport system permease protein
MQGIGRRVQYVLARNGTLIGLGVLILVFALQNDRFISWGNIKTIGQAVSELGVVAIPLALLVIAGAIDLSVGSVASMAGILAGKTMVSTGSTTLGIVAGLGFGLGAGAVNGLLVSYLNLNSIVVTLGALSVWAGMALYITDGQTVAGLPSAFSGLASTDPLGIPLGIFILAGVGILCWLILNRAPYGRRLYAVGGNERAAFLMGVPVRRVRFFMFVGVGGAASLGGLMLASKLSAATPITGQGLEINALTVVLLGGVAFAGGVGRVSGVIAGLFFVGALQNGLVVTGTSQFLQQVFLGLTLIAAVALDDTIRQFVRRSWSDVSTSRRGRSTPTGDVADASVARAGGGSEIA